MSVKTICLDAGHGGRDPGARANGIVEKDFALEMVVRIGHYLRASGLSTVFTRETDVLIGINARARFARNKQADLFLSVHCNAAGSPTACGAEAYVAAPDTRSVVIAKDILHRLGGLKLRGVKPDNQSQHASLGVLRGTYKQMPAILLELGFCTCLGDVKLMSDKYTREAWAVGIAGAITGVRALR